MKERVRLTVILVVFLVMLGITAEREQIKRTDLVYAESLDEVALTVDEEELTLREIAVYIAYQEREVQEEAVIYNPDKPTEYWNAYTNHNFVRSVAENAIKDMAAHDEIFYQMAVAEHIELDEREEAYLANEMQDFFMDLSEEQFARLGVTREDIEASMRKIAVANKYQSILSQAEGLYYEDYDYTGLIYELLVEEHVIEENEAVWDRISVGSITVNYK